MTAAEQLGLLDPNGRVHAAAHDTEIAAAEAVDAKALRVLVLRLLREHPEGLTDDEGGVLLGRLLGLNDDRLRFGRRRSDLVRVGLVVKTTQTRVTQYGCKAIVWQAAS